MLWVNRFKNEGHVQSRPIPGAPRTTTAEIDDIIVNTVRQKPFSTAVSIARDLKIGVKIVRSRLNEAGLFHHIPATETKLTDRHRELRVAFCEQNLGRDWDRVIFSDEKTFRSFSDRKMNLWHPKNERYNPKYVQEVPFSGRISCGIWGFITAMGVGGICEINSRNMCSVEYVETFEDMFIPSMDMIREDWRENMVFMHDNAQYHVCANSMNYIREHGITVLPWPAYSPDLNPIENVWARLVYDWGPEVIATKEAIVAKACERFDRMIGSDFFGNLYASMPKRLNEVISSGGHWCSY